MRVPGSHPAPWTRGRSTTTTRSCLSSSGWRGKLRVEYLRLSEYPFRSYKTTNILLLLIIFLHLFSFTEGTSLNNYISYFEPVYFDSSIIKRQLESHRVKRSLGTNTVNIDFKAQNRLFRLRLVEDSQNIFSDDITFETTEGQIYFDKSKVFSGFLEDDQFSKVDGIFTNDGLFDGHIQTRDNLFYVEPAKRYFKSEETPEFPAVIYSIDDVKHPHAMHSTDNHRQSSCESHHLHVKAKERWLADRSSFKSNHSDIGMFESLPESPNFHDGILRVDSDSPHRNPKRARPRKRSLGEYHSKKTTCMLYLQADHLFYEMKDRSEEACIEEMTRHVQRVNSIYRAVDFDLDGKPDNISFMIKRIKVHSQEALKDPTYRFPGNYGVEKFLEIFSEEDYDHFCLAYMFTYRDFEGGTLGLAWTGDLKNAGGVCEKHGHYRGSYKSLNTGIITLMNYGKPVPPAVSHVTMAHEMGHNFGSPHDPEADGDCVPGGEDGNYIMYARATSGDRNNNKKFSPCSLRSINEVLTAKALGPKGCFTAPEIAICGNGVVEEGEECDCGWEEDCLESCCWPQRTKYTANQLPCTLRPTAQCSPSQGPCCGRDCSYTRGGKCRDDNGCREDSFCDGRGVLCPQSVMKPNKTVCNEEFVCFQGECTGSICLAYGLESCQCMQGEGDSETKPCELCCKLPGPNSPCRSSFEWTKAPHDVPNMYSKAGTPCNNYQGYCDVFKKCREVDPLGPLLTLHDILFSDNSIKNLRNFITKYWYSVILAAVAVIALMITIIKLCGKKTPLVHHRRHRRRKIHHHNNNQTGGVGDNPEEVHIHPTTVTDDVSRQRRKRKESSKKVSTSTRKESKDKRSEDEKRKYKSAQALADRLTAKIISAPDTPDDQGRDKARDSQKLSSSVERKKHSVVQEALPDLIEVLEDKEVTKKITKDKNEQQPKEVTIAKLGPFKMSLEVKKNDDAVKNSDREHNARKKKLSNMANLPASDKTSEKNSQNQRRKKRSRSKSEHRKKESTVEPPVIVDKKDEHLYEEIEKKIEPSKDVKTETKKTKKSKDKIVVSKLVKSDRPLREKSPEKKEVNVTKYGRSISQPGPPANFNLMLPPESHHNLTRNLSLRATDKEKQSKLKRSSTSTTAIANIEEKSSNRSKQVEKMSLYDNHGFDLSPSLDRKQQKYLNLKDQIHTQLKMAAAAASSECGTVERGRGRRYQPMEETDGCNDSDCSDDPQSPPTQMQSLSEESSGGSTRRKSIQLSRVQCVKFDSSDDSEHPLGSLGLVHNSRQYNMEDSDSDSSNDCNLPVSTSNPHVRVPEANPVPVPLPRTSLKYEKLNIDQGCESDATIDIRNYGQSPGKSEDWEVVEGSDDSDSPSDMDDIAQQMMY